MVILKQLAPSPCTLRSRRPASPLRARALGSVRPTARCPPPHPRGARLPCETERTNSRILKEEFARAYRSGSILRSVALRCERSRPATRLLITIRLRVSVRHLSPLRYSPLRKEPPRPALRYPWMLQNTAELLSQGAGAPYPPRAPPSSLGSRSLQAYQSYNK